MTYANVLTKLSLSSFALTNMDIFDCVFPGLAGVFADITERLVSGVGSEWATNLWRATHPAALLSVASTSLKD